MKDKFILFHLLKYFEWSILWKLKTDRIPQWCSVYSKILPCMHETQGSITITIIP